MWFLCVSKRINEEITKKEPTCNAGLVCLGIFESFSELTNQVKTEFVAYPAGSLLVYHAEFSMNLNVQLFSNDGVNDADDLPW